MNGHSGSGHHSLRDNMCWKSDNWRTIPGHWAFVFSKMENHSCSSISNNALNTFCDSQQPDYIATPDTHVPVRCCNAQHCEHWVPAAAPWPRPDMGTMAHIGKVGAQAGLTSQAPAQSRQRLTASPESVADRGYRRSHLQIVSDHCGSECLLLQA